MPKGFAPIARPDARLLILGSMPGAASLAAGQYYAHPRNAFWPILQAVWGIRAALDYEDRLRALEAGRIAIWDVLSDCRRRTSLDADIEADSIVVNDFAGFFSRHPRIACVAFNGAMAEAQYRRQVLPALPVALQEIPLLRMPSTSPAHASVRFEAKARAWSILRAYTHPSRDIPAALHPAKRGARINSRRG